MHQGEGGKWHPINRSETIERSHGKLHAACPYIHIYIYIYMYVYVYVYVTGRASTTTAYNDDNTHTVIHSFIRSFYMVTMCVACQSHV